MTNTKGQAGKEAEEGIEEEQGELVLKGVGLGEGGDGKVEVGGEVEEANGEEFRRRISRSR